jgi:hypothetical protein
VIGSSVRYEVREIGGRVEIWRAEAMEVYNNDNRKVTNIQLHIGRRPILAVGNSDGDLEMLEYVDDGRGSNLAILVHHDDEERDFDYDDGTEKALEAAKERNWLTISVKGDFEEVFDLE